MVRSSRQFAIYTRSIGEGAFLEMKIYESSAFLFCLFDIMGVDEIAVREYVGKEGRT